MFSKHKESSHSENVRFWAKKYDVEEIVDKLIKHGFTTIAAISALEESDLDKMHISGIGLRKKVLMAVVEAKKKVDKMTGSGVSLSDISKFVYADESSSSSRTVPEYVDASIPTATPTTFRVLNKKIICKIVNTSSNDLFVAEWPIHHGIWIKEPQKIIPKDSFVSFEAIGNLVAPELKTEGFVKYNNSDSTLWFKFGWKLPEKGRNTYTITTSEHLTVEIDRWETNALNESPTLKIVWKP